MAHDATDYEIDAEDYAMWRCTKLNRPHMISVRFGFLNRLHEFRDLLFLWNFRPSLITHNVRGSYHTISGYGLLLIVKFEFLNFNRG